jgi:hypothetical protein
VLPNDRLTVREARHASFLPPGCVF